MSHRQSREDCAGLLIAAALSSLAPRTTAPISPTARTCGRTTLPITALHSLPAHHAFNSATPPTPNTHEDTMKSLHKTALILIASLVAGAGSAFGAQPPDVVNSDGQSNTAMGTSALQDLNGGISNT